MNAFTTMSVAECATLLQLGFRPTGIGTTSSGKRVAYFAPEAADALVPYLQATDEAAKLLGVPLKSRN